MKEDDLDGFENYSDSPWFEAIRNADTWRDASTKGPKKTGDLNLVVEQLRLRLVQTSGDIVLTCDECQLLIDLLARHRLKQKPGGRKVPVYKRSSLADLKLEIASESVSYYRSKGLSLDEAVKKVVGSAFVSEEGLRHSLQQKRHSDRLRVSRARRFDP